jgi:hypothetical protein
MTTGLLLRAAMVLSFLAWAAVCRVYLWPRIRNLPLHDAAQPILLLHVFRFVGVTFLIPGIVEPSLPSAWAAPAAYGDLGATALAWLALALGPRPGSRAALWAFNLWGTADLLFAFYQGRVVELDVRVASLGGAFWIVMLYVPLLLCTHAVLFVLLMRRGTIR